MCGALIMPTGGPSRGAQTVKGGQWARDDSILGRKKSMTKAHILREMDAAVCAMVNKSKAGDLVWAPCPPSATGKLRGRS